MSTDPTVCALLGASNGRLGAAVAKQTRQPNQVVVVTDTLARALEEVRTREADWIWLLEGSVTPRPDALQSLLEVLDRIRGLPDPAVLAGVVRTPGGALDTSRLPWYRRGALDLALAAASARVLPIRATGGPALVSRAAFEADLPRDAGPPSPAAVLTLTAHLLRFRAGYLVPESEYDAPAVPPDPLSDPRTAARLVLSGAVVGGDRIRVVHELVERLGTRFAERRRG